MISAQVDNDLVDFLYDQLTGLMEGQNLTPSQLFLAVQSALSQISWTGAYVKAKTGVD
jgi:hypothetical protein